METQTQTSPRPDYGIDAPGVVRNLFIGGSVAVLVWAVAFSGLLPRSEWTRFFVRNGSAMAIVCLGMGSYMYLSAKYGKIREREWLLDLKPGGWRGDETVLDVGCGLGVMLIGAAKRLSTGTATGIDIWQTQDLSGNNPDAARENARREGVADRVTILTADMRKIPFPDSHFDVVVSNAAIHNVYKADERATALREIARVLKPGGACILADVRHEAQYTSVLRAAGVTDVQRRDTSITSPLFALVSLGNVRFFVLIGRKPPASS
ncbi:MAG: class I SAM-dependent methyltransferase [Planctomycetes bacterium]|nr:class I SAM-dependent methyltransferase [Planctomycetota bacterium]